MFLIAFNIARIKTPTSATIASQILVDKPAIESIIINALIAIDNIMFCLLIELVRFASFTAKGILEPNATGLGAHVMPKIVELANNGELLDADGNQMKVYTVPLETKGGKPAVWDDIGTAEAYLKLIKEVANEYNKHGNTAENKYYGVPEFVMSDFAKNTDSETGIVYDSQKARDVFGDFKTKFNVEVAHGNIFVASPN